MEFSTSSRVRDYTLLDNNFIQNHTPHGDGTKGNLGGSVDSIVTVGRSRCSSSGVSSSFSSRISSHSSISSATDGEDVVASVLAAGSSSDSEETFSDDSGSEEIDEVFIKQQFSVISPLRLAKELRLGLQNYEWKRQITMHRFCRKVYGSISQKEESNVLRSFFPESEKAQAIVHSGRNILDLNGNINRPYFCKAVVLPPKNIKMYLENRSQYHRLGNQGLSETFYYVHCPSCDFGFPTPPVPGKSF